MGGLSVDLAGSGRTLCENHFKLLADGVVLRSQACFIANARLLRQSPEALRLTETMLELIDARVQARNRSLLTAYMQGESVEAMQRTCAMLNQRLRSLASGVELRVSTSELPNEG